MATTPNNLPQTKEIKYEFDDSIMIWKYDLSKTTYGPFEVEIKYKRGVRFDNPDKKKTLKDIILLEKSRKK